MSQQADSAFILDVFEYRETSSIVRLLTENDGRISVVAKGLRRARSGGGTGIIQPFNLISVRYYLKEGQTLGTYAGADLDRAWNAPRNSLESYALIAYWFDILRESGQAGESTVDIFQLTLEFMENQELGGGMTANTILYLTDLCRYLGFGFSWILCGNCGKSDHEITHFSIRKGILCSGCSNLTGGSIALKTSERQLIASYLQPATSGNEGTPDQSPLFDLLSLINRYLVHHLEHSFRSFPFVQSTFANT